MSAIAVASMLEWAERYAALRWPVFPCDGKRPNGKLVPHGLKDASIEGRTLKRWWASAPEANVGICTGVAFWVLDVDLKSGGPENLEALEHKHGKLPDTLQQQTGSGGRHYLFALPNFTVTNSRGQLPAGIDVRGIGGYIVAPPSIHPQSRNAYEWDGLKEFEDQPILPAPEWLLGLLRPAENSKPKAPPLPEKISEGGRNEILFKEAARVRNLGWTEEEIYRALQVINQQRCSPPLSNDELRTIAHSVLRYQPSEQRIVQPTGQFRFGPAPPPREDPVLNFTYTDTGNADRLEALCGEDLKFSAAHRSWIIWDGRRWEFDRIDRHEVMAQAAFCELVQRAERVGLEEPQYKWAIKSLNLSRIESALRVLRPRLTVAAHQLDQDPWALNFLNGTLDLRNGELRQHVRADMLTRIVYHDYRPQAQCPRFLQFLERIMGGGPDASEEANERAARLIEYLQRVFGYALTGKTDEKAVFILWGAGNNGKSTLLYLFNALLQDYATVLQIDTLMTRQENSNNQADLADLKDARFVITSETEEGQRLAEGKLKRITQGQGKIKAVRKYENPIEFPETHKLFMDANHKPNIRGDDKAIWKRLHLIPFEVTIPDDEIDRDLPAKLLAEAEGVLAWAVQGCLRWQKDGLMPPEEVTGAAAEWRAEMDQVGRFLEEECEVNERDTSSATSLYQAYVKWSEARGERPMTGTAFGKRVSSKFERVRRTAGMFYNGVGLRADQRAEQ